MSRSRQQLIEAYDRIADGGDGLDVDPQEAAEIAAALRAHGRDDAVYASSDPDAPLPVSSLGQARAASEEYMRLACTPLSANDPGMMWALLAIARELRALGLILERPE